MESPDHHLKIDGWTPALVSMATEIMDELLSRPACLVIMNSQKKCAKDFYFNIKNKIQNRKYQSISSWIDDLRYPLDFHSQDPFFAAASQDLSHWIQRKCQPLQEFSKFQFKSALSQVLQELKEANEMKIED